MSYVKPLCPNNLLAQSHMFVALKVSMLKDRDIYSQRLIRIKNLGESYFKMEITNWNRSLVISSCQYFLIYIIFILDILDAVVNAFNIVFAEDKHFFNSETVTRLQISFLQARNIFSRHIKCIRVFSSLRQL